MLDLHFPRHQERANLHVCRGLLLTHLFNRGRPVLFEVGSEREQEILVERSTRSLQGTARVRSGVRRGPVILRGAPKAERKAAPKHLINVSYPGLCSIEQHV